jgi:hypothetical protein
VEQLLSITSVLREEEENRNNGGNSEFPSGNKQTGVSPRNFLLACGFDCRLKKSVWTLGTRSLS